MNSSDWMGEVLRRVEKEWEAQPPHTRRYIPPPKSLRLPESAPDDIEQAVARASDLGLNPNAVRIIWQRNILMQTLTDLIAELRRTTKGYLSPRAYAITVEQQREMADAAEAQLREAMRNDE